MRAFDLILQGAIAIEHYVEFSKGLFITLQCCQMFSPLIIDTGKVIRRGSSFTRQLVLVDSGLPLLLPLEVMRLQSMKRGLLCKACKTERQQQEDGPSCADKLHNPFGVVTSSHTGEDAYTSRRRDKQRGDTSRYRDMIRSNSPISARQLQ